MSRLSGTLVLTALLSSTAFADPLSPAATDPDASVAPASTNPTPALEQPDHRVAAASTLGGLYVGFVGWMYYAWYNKHKALSEYKFGGDGWLGDETYAGGADKFGHAWATMSLARLGTEMLYQWGGFSRTTSILTGTLASELLFVGVEVKDGFFYEFSFSDLAGDTAGALLAAALSYWPRLDEMIDFRVQYWPSNAYSHMVTSGGSAPTGGKLNIAEDYSGQTYFVAFHLGSLHALRDVPYAGTLSRFVDVAFGFDSRGYKPTPLVDGVPTQLPVSEHHQNIFLGVSLNAQGVFDWLLEGRHHESVRKLTHAAFEVFNLPYTGGPLLNWERTPSRLPHLDGA